MEQPARKSEPIYSQQTSDDFPYNLEGTLLHCFSNFLSNCTLWYIERKKYIWIYMSIQPHKKKSLIILFYNNVNEQLFLWPSNQIVGVSARLQPCIIALPVHTTTSNLRTCSLPPLPHRSTQCRCLLSSRLPRKHKRTMYRQRKQVPFSRIRPPCCLCRRQLRSPTSRELVT